MTANAIITAFIAATLIEALIIIALALKLRRINTRAPAGDNDAWECGV